MFADTAPLLSRLSRKPFRAARVIERCLALLIVLPWCVAAHDIPNDVTVQMFLRPSGNKLDLLVRVPVKSMRDIDFPKLGPGYLDLSPARSVLAGCRHRVAGAPDRNSRRRQAPAGPEVAGCASIARIRQVVRIVRHRDGAHHRRAPAREHSGPVGPGYARRVARIPDSVRPFRILPPPQCRYAGRSGDHGAPVLAAGRRDSGVRVRGRRRLGSARPQHLSSFFAIHPRRILAHPGWHRSPALSSVSGDSIPPVSTVAPDRNVVHRRAFLRADRLGLWTWAGCAVVPAAD